jgi:predicted nucleic acid-binding protein
MILVDANLLTYARVSTLPQHEAARAWLDVQLNGTAAVGLPWPSLLTYVRLTTNPRIIERPETTESAWRQVEAWLDCAPVWMPQPTDRLR